MRQPVLRPGFNRRHPHISHEELRRQLLDADRDRFRLQNEIRELQHPARRAAAMLEGVPRRTAVGIGTLLAAVLAGGVAWQMCTSWARANEPPAVRLATVSVPVHIVEEPAAPQPPAARAVNVKRGVRPRVVRAAAARGTAPPSTAHKKAPPRPLSPGEFGRRAVAGW